ncbi:MAG TPA: metallophosphoesterase [Tepidisphaeraceae bacterium]|nr:metallophosphoesterase [Tepidisphaeraceae bacterium]
MTFWIFLLSFAVLDVVWWNWADHRLRSLSRARLWRGVLAAFMGAQVVCFAVMLALRIVGMRPMIPLPLLAGIYIWHLTVLPATMVVLTGGTVVAWVVGAARRVVASFRPVRVETLIDSTAGEVSVELPAATGPTRREVMLAAVVAMPPLLTTGSVGASMARLDDFRINRLTVGIPDLPSALEGMTIAHITDVHTGRFTPASKLAAIVDRTNSLNADLVVLTGDLIDFNLSDLPTALEMVRGLRARVGMFMCEGNHDLIEDREEFELRVKAAGVPLLLNESALISIHGHPVQMLGLRWGREGRHDSQIERDMESLMRLRQRSVFPILLAHHPHAFDSAAQAGIPLTLAGHTHGGQLMLTRDFGAGSLMFRYWSGLYQRAGSSLVVSNGVGNWFPLRINAPAEIVHITLSRS